MKVLQLINTESNIEGQEEILFCLINPIEGHTYFSTESVRVILDLFHFYDHQIVQLSVVEFAYEYLQKIDHLVENRDIYVNDDYFLIKDCINQMM